MLSKQNHSNHNRQPIRARKVSREANENSEQKTRTFSEARENASDHVAIGLSFESDWLRKWREFFSEPITELINENQSNPELLSTII